VKRIASVIGLDPEHWAEYERLHASVWPGVLERLSRSGIRNYSIYRYDDLLFSYFEYIGDDFDADMAAMVEDEESQRWWAVCKPLQRPLGGRGEGEWLTDLPELFHLD